MGEVALRKTQAVLEVTRGTKIAATRKVYGKGMWKEKVDAVRPDNEMRGTLVRHYRAQPGKIDAAFSFDGSVTFEDLAWWFQLALKGGVTGVLRNTTVYDYTFVPTTTADDLKSMTVEWGDDTQAWQAGFGMVDKFEMTGKFGEAIAFSADVIVDDWATATFTGALADRVTEDALTHLAKLSIGNAGAVPSSYMTGRFIGFKFTIANHPNPKYFMDGAGAKFTGMGRERREYMLECTFEGNSATVTERANYDTMTARVVRLTVGGSTIVGSSSTTAKAIDIVIPGIWTSYDPGDNDTNTIFTGTLESQYDAALAYDLSAVVTNALVTLP